MDNVIAKCVKLQRGRHKYRSLLITGKLNLSLNFILKLLSVNGLLPPFCKYIKAVQSHTSFSKEFIHEGVC